jgi:SCP-2 sterol transfer family
VTSWLSQEWFDQALPIWTEVPGLDGLSGRVQCEISGGPAGDVSCYWVFDAGRLGPAGVGRIENPEVSLAVRWDDAAAVQRGDLDPSVAFMQGRLKVNGSMGVMMELLARARTPECRERQRTVAELSGF